MLSHSSWLYTISNCVFDFDAVVGTEAGIEGVVDADIGAEGADGNISGAAAELSGSGLEQGLAQQPGYTASELPGMTHEPALDGNAGQLYIENNVL